MSLDSILSVTSAFGEAVVLALLVRRGTWKMLPAFSIYLLWTLLSDIMSFYFERYLTHSSYVRFYIMTMSVDAILQFAVLVELGWSVLRPVRNSLPRGTLYALAGLVAVVGLAIWPLAGIATPDSLDSRSAIMFHLNETFAILRIICFLVLAGFSQLLSIGWRDRELQIATGLGLYSIVSLLATLLYSHQTSKAQFLFLNDAVSISYLCTLSYWVYSFSAKEYQRKEFSPQMQEFLLLMGGGARKP